MEQSTKDNIVGYAGSLFGAFLFVSAINLIIVPQGLFSGTMTGIAQMIESVLRAFVGLQIPEGSNVTGIAVLMLNIPLLALAMRVTSKGFLYKSVVTIIFTATTMSLMPIPLQPLIDDPLTSCIIGGALAGFGAGFTLRCGGSGGGTDIIGVYCSVKYPNFTVGKVSIIIGSIVFSYAAIVYDFNTVIYSVLFTAFYIVAIDHAHFQNIKTSALIFTRNPEAVQAVVHKLGRGATCWEGQGAYTGKHSHIFTTVISKYETHRLKRIVNDADPNAFIIFNNKVDVSGNFERRL
ncbi:MAG: YitT family protein [Defluviitaleaceae bacterium]|nr:YitT family protein [Defluviitaleaceae bacterium]